MAAPPRTLVQVDESLRSRRFRGFRAQRCLIREFLACCRFRAGPLVDERETAIRSTVDSS
jgi:hypothetical protein